MMKNSILRSGLALACAVSLASCGGSNTGTLYLGGTVTGVTQEGLVLQNNGGSDLAVAPSSTGTSTFLFKDLVPSDSVYNVTVKTSPPNTEGCTPTYNKGNTGLYSVTSVVITCIIKTHSLTGTVTGLGGNSGLVLANGSNQVAVAADGKFEMARVSLGYPYGITVLQQPTNRTCTVANGVGTIAGDVSNVAVTCVSTGA